MCAVALPETSGFWILGFQMQFKFILAPYGVLLLIKPVSRDFIDPVATVVGG
jgi:hypothetical protein